jgi:MotA/TolQ/ExbB proton channel family protein
MRMSEFSRQLIAAVMRASARRASTVRQEFADGVNGLANVARTAPWVGVLGTALAIPDAFPACGCENSSYLAAVADRLSLAMRPTALGLAIGLAALYCHRYLTARVEDFGREMDAAIVEMANQLEAYRGHWQVGSMSRATPLFGADTPQQLESEARFEHQSRVAAGVSLAAAYCLQLFRYFYDEALPLERCAWAACRHVAFVFVLSLPPAFVLWSRVLHRRPGGLILAAALLCLCWCVAEFWL